MVLYSTETSYHTAESGLSKFNTHLKNLESQTGHDTTDKEIIVSCAVLHIPLTDNSTHCKQERVSYCHLPYPATYCPLQMSETQGGCDCRWQEIRLRHHTPKLSHKRSCQITKDSSLCHQQAGDVNLILSHTLLPPCCK